MNKLHHRKRFTALALALVYALLLTAALTGLTGCTGYDRDDLVGGLRIYYSSSPYRDCFVGDYYFDGETTDITIPDEYLGRPVTRLGGYRGRGAPVRFGVDLRVLENCSDLPSYIWRHYLPNGEAPVIPDDCSSFGVDLSSSDLMIDVRREDIPFTVRIGNNITDVMITDMYVYHVNADGSVTAYRPAYYFICSPGNPVLYSEDGVLYSRETGEPLWEPEDDRLVVHVHIPNICPPEDIVISPVYAPAVSGCDAPAAE